MEHAPDPRLALHAFVHCTRTGPGRWVPVATEEQLLGAGTAGDGADGGLGDCVWVQLLFDPRDGDSEGEGDGEGDRGGSGGGGARERQRGGWGRSAERSAAVSAAAAAPPTHWLRIDDMLPLPPRRAAFSIDALDGITETGAAGDEREQILDESVALGAEPLTRVPLFTAEWTARASLSALELAVERSGTRVTSAIPTHCPRASRRRC